MKTDFHSLICVRPPYFALGEIFASSNDVRATVPAEQDLGRERGPISGAEAGRHLAILGSCALARVNPRPERHYYLATSAELELLARPNTGTGQSSLHAHAHAWFTAKRAGRARSTLFAAERPLYALDVSYTVLGEGSFQRLFSNARRDSIPPPALNPHARRPSLSAIVVSGRRASCVLPPLTPELCAGHFDGYPMLPVAIVMRGLSDLAGELLSRVSEDELAGYLVRRARVRAYDFALPPEQLLFEVEYGGSSSDLEHTFVCRASSLGGKAIGEMSLVLAAELSAHKSAGFTAPPLTTY